MACVHSSRVSVGPDPVVSPRVQSNIQVFRGDGWRYRFRYPRGLHRYPSRAGEIRTGRAASLPTCLRDRGSTHPSALHPGFSGTILRRPVRGRAIAGTRHLLVVLLPGATVDEDLMIEGANRHAGFRFARSSVVPLLLSVLCAASAVLLLTIVFTSFLSIFILRRKQFYFSESIIAPAAIAAYWRAITHVVLVAHGRERLRQYTLSFVVFSGRRP